MAFNLFFKNKIGVEPYCFIIISNRIKTTKLLLSNIKRFQFLKYKNMGNPYIGIPHVFIKKYTE